MFVATASARAFLKAVHPSQICPFVSIQRKTLCFMFDCPEISRSLLRRGMFPINLRIKRKFKLLKLKVWTFVSSFQFPFVDFEDLDGEFSSSIWICVRVYMDICLPSSCHKSKWHDVLTYEAAWYDLHVTTCYILIDMRGSLIRSSSDCGAGIFPVRSNRWSWWQKLDRRRRRTTNPIIHHPFTGERPLVLLVLPAQVFDNKQLNNRTTNPIIHHPLTGERPLVLQVLPVVPELPALVGIT